MIKIPKSQTADTRSCDYANVDKQTLLNSSYQHITDVRQGFDYFIDLMNKASDKHDHDKFTAIDQFHFDFLTGFKSTTWWDNHRKVNRHHILQDDGIPPDVNLIDVMEFIIDCVMAGMARTGVVYPLELKPELLQKAFDNTVELLKSQIVVED